MSLTKSGPAIENGLGPQCTWSAFSRAMTVTICLARSSASCTHGLSSRRRQRSSTTRRRAQARAESYAAQAPADRKTSCQIAKKHDRRDREDRRIAHRRRKTSRSSSMHLQLRVLRGCRNEVGRVAKATIVIEHTRTRCAGTARHCDPLGPGSGHGESDRTFRTIRCSTLRS